MNVAETEEIGLPALAGRPLFFLFKRIQAAKNRRRRIKISRTLREVHAVGRARFHKTQQKPLGIGDAKE